MQQQTASAMTTMPAPLAPVSLTIAQQNVVLSRAQHIFVSACPGAGKSTTLCARVRWLIEAQRAQPYGIVMLTFSVKARKDLERRLEQLVGREIAMACHVFTFHALGARLLSRSGRLERNFSSSLLTGRELHEFVAEVAASVPRSGGGSAAQGPRLSPDELKSLVHIIEMHKSGAPRVRATQWALDVAAQYELRKRGRMGGRQRDFADLVLDATQLLAEVGHGHVRAELDRCLDAAEPPGAYHLLLDELQDVNPAQLALVRALLPALSSVVAVGDLNQSIYSWRGAELDAFASLEHALHPRQPVRLQLSDTFRCPAAVVHAANAVLKLLPEGAGAGGSGFVCGPSPSLAAAAPAVRILRAQSEAEEYTLVAAHTRELHARGARLGDIAVLCRLNRPADAMRAELQRQYQLPTTGASFDVHERDALRPLVDYLELALGPTDMRNDEIFRRILNVPARSIGPKAVGYLERAHELVCEVDRKTLAPRPRSLFGMCESLVARGFPTLQGAAGGGATAKLSFNGAAARGLTQLVQAVRALEQAACAGQPPSHVLELLLARVDFESHLQRTGGAQHGAGADGGRVSALQALSTPQPFGGCAAPGGGAESPAPASAPALDWMRRVAAEYDDFDPSRTTEAQRLVAPPSADTRARRSLERLVADLRAAEASGEAVLAPPSGAPPAAAAARSSADARISELLVTTIHAAKGREWDHVVLIHCDEGVMPLPPRPGADEREARQHAAEEVRLAYVAMTRARKSLTFVCAERPSRLLSAIPEALVANTSAPRAAGDAELATPAAKKARAGPAHDALGAGAAAQVRAPRASEPADDEWQRPPLRLQQAQLQRPPPQARPLPPTQSMPQPKPKTQQPQPQPQPQPMQQPQQPWRAQAQARALPVPVPQPQSQPQPQLQPQTPQPPPPPQQQPQPRLQPPRRQLDPEVCDLRRVAQHSTGKRAAAGNHSNNAAAKADARSVVAAGGANDDAGQKMMQLALSSFQSPRMP